MKFSFLSYREICRGNRLTALFCAVLMFVSALAFMAAMPTAVASSYANGDAPGWYTEVVDHSLYAGQYSSSAIDSQGYVHLCYFDGWTLHLKHATNTGGSWACQVVDDTIRVGQYPSIALDSQDKVHISYYDELNGDLKYAHNIDGYWTRTTIENVGDVGQYTSIAIDTNDKVHISYYDSTNGDLKYATNAGGSWDCDPIDNINNVGQYTSIALDSSDKVHISYYDYTNGDLKYANNAGGSWAGATVDNVGDVGQYTSIALDSNDQVHISYYDLTNNDLKYATNAGGSWDRTTIDSDDVVGECTSVAIDSNDKVHISYYDLTNGDLKYANNVDGSWECTTIDSADDVGEFTSLVIDSNDQVHISYYDLTNNDLRYATDTAWYFTYVSSNVGEMDYYSSMAIDTNDQVHICYYDYGNGDLKYATNASGSWVCTTIDSEGDVGECTSMAIDSNDAAHISYYDSTNTHLKYANNVNGSWVCTTIDSDGDVGEYTSIAIDSQDQVHISYYDGSNSDLKYATNANGSWNCETVDSIGNVGWHTSMAIDSNDKVHISYYDRSNGYLKCANNTNGSWECETVDSSGNVGWHTSTALDSSDKVHISYYDSTNGDLKYANNVNGSWERTTIDSGDVGEHTSLAIDPYDQVHISYYDITNGDLKYATNAGGSWKCAMVDGHGDVGQYTSLALDSVGKARIVYEDRSLGAIKLASDRSPLDLHAPSFTNQPANGQETVAYEYAPTFNEMVSITAFSTNGPFLSWDGSKCSGTPNTDQAGTYWLNITALSASGHLTAYQNSTFVIGDSWAPTFINAPGDGQETIDYHYAPGFNESANITAHSTNAPFLNWDGSNYSGRPNMTQAGAYWMNITAMSDDGLLSVYQNSTFIIGDSWVPTFTSNPGDGQETVAYQYYPTFNETVSIIAHSTSAPFLSWDGSNYSGTPNTEQAGTYWINMTVWSELGSLSTWQNFTFVIGESWAPAFNNVPVNGQETLAYEYVPEFNETVSVTVQSTNAPFLSWDGSRYSGTPNTAQSGTYWINMTVTSVNGLLSVYQNYTLVIRDTWSPSFTNVPANGQETVAYQYAPTFNETVSVTAHSTNAPFLTWDGSKYFGTPAIAQDGTYWINITATSVDGLLSRYQNRTFIIGDSWPPTFTNVPVNGKETVAYQYAPTFNELVSMNARSTNAPFLSWDGTKYSGTPSTAQAGTYWINITAISVNGHLSAYQNSTFVIGESWVPTFTNIPSDGQETVAFHYEPTFNETVSMNAHSTNAPFLSWGSSKYTGTPGTSQAGTYWINITATSVNGLLSTYQNSTFVIGESWAPTFTNVPTNGQETVEYQYAPTFNETVSITAHRTNAPFLSWNGSGYSGVPSTTQSGRYWVNITVTSVNGLLSKYQNTTLVIGDSWSPTFESEPTVGNLFATMTYEYSVSLNESAELTMETNATFLGMVNGVISGTLEAGSYYVHIGALSESGLLASWQNYTLVVVIDVEAPVVTIISPNNGALLNTRTLVLTWNATDGNGSGMVGSWCKVDDGDWIARNNSKNVTLQLGDGAFMLRVKVIDAVGNAGYANISVDISTAAPTWVSITPIGNAVPLDRPIHMMFVKAMNASSVLVTVNGAPVLLTWNGNNVTCGGDWEHGAEYAVVVNGKDLYGNAMAECSWSFKTEAQAFTISGVLVDEHGNPVANADIYVDGVSVAVTDANGTYQFQLPNGSYVISIVHDGFEDRKVDLTVGDEPAHLDLVLERTADGANWWLWIVLVAVGGMAVFVIYRVYRK